MPTVRIRRGDDWAGHDVPIAEDQITLDSVTHVCGFRNATGIRMFDHGRRARFELRGYAVLPTAPNLRRHQAGEEAVSVGATTSDPVERFTRPLMQREGVRISIGKGGVREESSPAYAERGGVYLAIVGGTAALETTWIEAIEDVDLDDLTPESLWQFRARGFGPLPVAIDSVGGSLFAEANAAVAASRTAESPMNERRSRKLSFLAGFQGAAPLVFFLLAFGVSAQEAPPPPPPAPDCGCGVPDAPRGPR